MKKQKQKVRKIKEVTDDFVSHRTSWKWFEKVLKNKTNYEDNFMFEAMQLRVQIEILKELQHINDSIIHPTK